ncbi:MAG: VCBS repeat-containing protein [Phycisphaerales bacterium]|nr:MAG: VCBS repeat-containing protein [Phycisphaerales bacterium]
MKHSRVTAASFAAALSPLAGIAASLTGTVAARGMDVPFTEQVISTAAGNPVSVFATDSDGDEDTDVVSASASDDKIAWYESDPGAPGPPTFTERVISTAADVACSVFATDLDGDGDTDVLSASRLDDKIAWYESDGGWPPTFTERVISTAADGAHSVFATDLDGDGDIDVLSASDLDDKIAW